MKRIATQLAAIDPAQLAAYFDAKAMDKASIYPSDWVEQERNGTAPAQLLQDAFVRPRDFFQRSADADEWFEESGPRHYAEHVRELQAWARSDDA